MRISFVVTGLDIGGAEMMLWKLLSRIDRTRFEPSVIALSGEATAMLPAFRELGIECVLLAWRPGRGIIGGMRRLARALREREPDIVQGWMYHGNIAATLGTAWGRLRSPVLWNIRATLMDRQHEKRLTLLVIWLGGKLSFSPAAIINNSETSAQEHEQRMGYRARGRVVLPNGFDTEKFTPSRERHAALRNALGLGDSAVIVGMIARYHPMKRHDVFLHAAELVARVHPDTHFVLVGDGTDGGNAELARRIEEHGMVDRVHLMGRQTDMPGITAGLDIAVSSSSSGEGFPNVIGEAMSCGVPCVVTDVGDSAAIVGDTGIAVPAGNSDALAAAISRLIAAGEAHRAELGARARKRAIEKFSLGSVVRQYEQLYMRVLQEHGSH